MKYHDELADLKSYFDGHLGDETFEEETLGSNCSLCLVLLFNGYIFIIYIYMYTI